ISKSPDWASLTADLAPNIKDQLGMLMSSMQSDAEKQLLQGALAMERGVITPEFAEQLTLNRDLAEGAMKAVRELMGGKGQDSA
uniref:hypothetical protein n=1 Tax=Escherichia coli TaxID=562 RepID=UPI0013B41561